MKRITGPEDLAINGTRPAFEEPLHVGRPNLGSRKAFLHRMSRMYDHRWLTNNGPLVQELERSIAEMLGVRHCIAMCNGTVALEIAIRGLGLSGEVIIPSFTFIATAHALQWQEITPVFADIDPRSHNISPNAVRRMITPRTSGIVAVNLWGRGCEIETLQAIADEFDISLIFDSAHAFGCTHGGQLLGSFGNCEILSFHATKFFNSMEGGAIVTNDDTLAERVRLMRNFGFAGYDNVIYPGVNGKMTEASAAMGLTNLEGLEHFLSCNARNYEVYRRGLGTIKGLSLLLYPPDEQSNLQYIVVEVEETFPVSRDELITALHAENVLARRYFWPGCHRMMPYRELFPHAGLLLPETEALAERVAVFPTGDAVGPPEINTIIDILRVLGAKT